MTPTASWRAAAGLAILTAGACGPRPAVQPQSTDLVALAADPEDGHIGRGVVQAQGATVELTREREATRVVAGRPPAAPIVLTPEDVQRVFGDALAARPPQPREFLLYFLTGTDDLTAESLAELPQIVAFVRDRAAPDVSVIGHTDTTGDRAANAQLGVLRARLIRDRLVAVGVPAAQIEVTSHGEADLLIPTADNVAEARNRRVEVTVR